MTKRPEDMTVAELQAQIGYFQAILNRKVLGDPAQGVSVAARPEIVFPTPKAEPNLTSSHIHGAADRMKDWERRAPALEGRTFYGSYYFVPSEAQNPLQVRPFLHASNAWMPREGVGVLMKQWVAEQPGSTFDGWGHLMPCTITFASQADKEAFVEAWDNQKRFNPLRADANALWPL